MLERDMFAELIANHGIPQESQPVSILDAEAYRERVPEGMIDFWVKYGRGRYRNGYYWISNPASFAPVLARIFKDDPEFHAEDMTLLTYTAFGYCTLWNKNGFTMLIDFERSEVSSQSSARIDPESGKEFSPDFLVGSLLNIAFSDDTEWFEMACERLGRPGRGEIFSYAPLLQLGGMEDLDNLRRVEATVYMDMVAQLEPFTLIELTSPEPNAPMGRLRPVRRIGPQQ
ncbi:MAG: GAD-like domain-containing protein [Pseudomonadota bacterium]